MKNVLLRARSYGALGWRNLARVAIYRLGLRLGVHPVLKVRASLPHNGSVFTSVAPPTGIKVRNSAWDDGIRLYGYHRLPGSDDAPDFLTNPVTGRRWRTADRDWSDIPDFDAVDGDVKMIWELSRFEWVVAFAQAARVGVPGALDRLNRWIDQWCRQNPAFKGPNWKCGQESSLRILHLAVAALILDPAAPPSAQLLDLVEAHLRRIKPTLSYALGQDNNHGTSEAAALFVGGSWLASAGRAQGSHYAQLGRRWLEERARRLFLPDGTFSQYSINYHRLALDTFSLVEVWRRHMMLSPFSDKLTKRLRAAADWLYSMVSPVTGDAPNFGHNDGARIIVLTDTSYRDYRPTVARSKALFADEQVYDAPEIDDDLAWLSIAVGMHKAPPPKSRLFDAGGLAVLHHGRAMAVLRYPHFKFRPAHDDIMHLEFWLDGKAILPDGGSFSYNAGEEWIRYFMGADSHNSVAFDNRGHMPKLSRFLFGAWPKGRIAIPLYDDGEKTGIACSYRDWQGAAHRRDVRLSAEGLSVIDKVDGRANGAILRWRLGDDQTWTRSADIVTNGSVRMALTAEPAPQIDHIVEGHQSLHYNEKTALPVWEVGIRVPGCFTTTVTW